MSFDAISPYKSVQSPFPNTMLQTLQYLSLPGACLPHPLLPLSEMPPIACQTLMVQWQQIMGKQTFFCTAPHLPKLSPIGP